MHGARLLGRLGAHAQTLMAVTVSSFARLHFTNELATAQKRFVSRLRRTQTKVGDARMRALLTARKVEACALRGESWKIAETPDFQAWATLRGYSGTEPPIGKKGEWRAPCDPDRSLMLMRK